MESKRSCCSPATCCGMPVQRGCFIFAVINAVLCSLCSLGGLAFLGVAVSPFFDGESRGSSEMVLVWLFLGISLTCCIGSIVALLFGVILCVGVNKNKPRYVMSYLVYGLVAETLSVVGTVAFICMEWGNTPLVWYALIPLGVCVIYSGILLLVYQTYHAMLSAPAPVTAQRELLHTEDC